MQSATLVPLMRVRPEAAAEILLATTIEESPEERYDRSFSLEKEYGLEFGYTCHPTMYWQSPFLSFLQVNFETAIGALISLVEFCTDRWEAELRRHPEFAEGGDLPHVKIVFADASSKTFVGGYSVLNWSHESSQYIGQVCCALVALEQWLYTKLDQGVDVSGYVDRIFRSTRSLGLIGVLLDVGKRNAMLFRSSLLPLLTSGDLFFWDEHRVEILGVGFDQYDWARKGDAVFNMARDWWFAPHRQIALRDVARPLIADHPEVAQAVARAVTSWPAPSDKKADLEFRVLKVELDPAHYETIRSEAGATVVTVRYPIELQQEIASFQQSARPARQALRLPEWCRSAMASKGLLPPEQAAALAAMIDDPNALGNNDDLEEQRRIARIAVACTLLLKVPEWLEQHPATRQRARELFEGVFANFKENPAEIFQRHWMQRREELHFAAPVVVANVLNDGATPSNSFQAMFIVTSGDGGALATLMYLVFANRAALGGIWWRLQNLCVLWSALVTLAPHYEPPPSLPARWIRWLRSLRNLTIKGDEIGASHIDFVDVAKRVERLEHSRWVRQQKAERLRAVRKAGGRYSPGLASSEVKSAFTWLWVDGSDAVKKIDASEMADRCLLLKRLLALEVWQHPATGEEDDREPLPYDLGYQVLSSMAWMVAGIAESAATDLWQDVLKLGPGYYHHFVGHFLRSFLSTVARASNPAAVTVQWRAMLEFALRSQSWAGGRYWYHREELFRQLLGFGSELFLNNVPGYRAAVASMRYPYEQWAKKYLRSDEDNIAGLCNFLASPTGTDLRVAGLIWIHEAMQADPELRLSRREGSADAVIALVDLVLNEEAGRVSNDAKARDAVLAITGRLVALQTPAALTLQEHARVVLRREIGPG
jgi:hypothetical protein